MDATITAESTNMALIDKSSVRKIRNRAKRAYQKKIKNGRMIIYSKKKNAPAISFVNKGNEDLLYWFRFNPRMFFVEMNL